jgi:hypothetical protein
VFFTNNNKDAKRVTGSDLKPVETLAAIMTAPDMRGLFSKLREMESWLGVVGLPPVYTSERIARPHHRPEGRGQAPVY